MRKNEEAFQNYSPENGSRMSSITTYFLLLLRLLKDGYATMEQLADNSEEIGHYWKSADAKHEFEKQSGTDYSNMENNCLRTEDYTQM